MKKAPLWSALLIVLLVSLACGEATPVPAPTSGPLPTVSADVLPRGSRSLEVAITLPENEDYDAAIALVQSLGAESVPVSLFWDEIETSPGVFNPDPNWLPVINQYYPAQNLKVTLTISVLDTVTDRRPADLRGLPWDDPQVIARFTALLDTIAAQIPDVQLTALAIGNEIDGVLGTQAANWEAYTTFFAASAAHARALWPGVPVGAKVMFSGARQIPARIRPLWDASDAVMLTYYPLKSDFTVRPPQVVADDVAQMVAIAQGKPVYLLEAGYPSGETCNSTPEQQAAFIRQVFRAWDAHAEAIPLISFTWLSDLPPKAVREFQGYYGVNNRAFGEYLRTLGMRTWKGAGSDKPAFLQLEAEAAARGWR